MTDKDELIRTAYELLFNAAFALEPQTRLNAYTEWAKKVEALGILTK